MPFGNIVAQTVTYEPRTPGLYTKAGLTFDMPQNEFRIRGAMRGKDSVSASVTRVLQKDITVGSGVLRRNAVVTLNIQMPNLGGFTAAEIDSLVADISEFITGNVVSRLLQGES